MFKIVKYYALFQLTLICVRAFSQDADQLYPDTLLQRLIREKHVKQVDIIDAIGKEHLLQTSYYNANGDEILLKNFQNGYSYVKQFENGKLRKTLIYSTIEIKDTFNAQDKYIHWFDELGNLTREDNIINGKLFQTTEHSVEYSGDTCLLTERKSDGRYSSIRIITSGSKEWIDYISYDSHKRITDVKSYYRLINKEHQLIEEGERNYEDSLGAYLMAKNFDPIHFFNKDTIYHIVLSSKLNPNCIWQRKYHYANQLLDSVEENNRTVKYITYNSKLLPDEVRCKYPIDETTKADCGKTKFIYNELFLPTQVLQYDSEGTIVSKTVYTYSF
jgi:hypothetical protein